MTPAQKELARHALGLPNKQRTSNRNRFVTGPGPGNTDHAEWMAMVEAGEAGRRDGSTLPFGGDDMFWLTPAGAEAARNPREKLCPRSFPKPAGAAR